MKRSEFIEKLTALVGDDDVEIYFEVNGETGFSPDFEIELDYDGDIIIKP